jgi:hypothetical protein
MATNNQAITDLLSAKSKFEDQVSAGAGGNTLSNLMAAIYSIQQAVGQLVLQGLADNYTPPTKDFLSATTQGQGFVKELKAIDSDFTKVADVVSAVATVMQYVV